MNNKKKGLAIRIVCMVLAGLMIASALYSTIYFLFFA